MPLPTNPSDFRAYVDAFLDRLRQSSPERATRAQAKLIGQFNGLALSTNQKIFEAMELASEDVRQGNSECPIYAVQAPTGAGKTTGACALVAGRFAHDQNYSAAIVTSTIKGAQDTFDTLATFINADEICLLTSAHQRSDVKAIQREFGKSVAKHVTTYGPATVEKLMSSPIAICTHERWKADTTLGDKGVLLFNSKRRHNVIIDEQPDLVASFDAAPSDLEHLQEQLKRRPEWEEIASIVAKIAERLRIDLHGKGRPRFEAASRLIGHDDAAPVLSLNSHSASYLSNEACHVINFLKAASEGNCFAFREGKTNAQGVRSSSTFWSYSPGFRPHSGLIILDATAALSPLASLTDNVRVLEIQSPDYRHLALNHIEAPRKFDEVARSTATSDKLTATYIAWVGDVVNENTADGDKILVVLNKHHTQTIGTKPSRDTEKSGREISYANWGQGIGSNEWRKCTHVFLFSEYHRPMASHICEAAALRGQTVESVVEDATHRFGAFEAANNAHRLRWFKQMACRGTIRKIDANGLCSPMKLFTTMDRRLLVEHWRELFPGAPEPRFDLSHATEPTMNPARLAHYLLKAQSDGVTDIAAGTVANDLGISVRAVRVAFNGAGCSYMKTLGWRYPMGHQSIYREAGDHRN